MTPASLQQAITPAAGQFSLAVPFAAPEHAASAAALYAVRVHCVPSVQALDCGWFSIAITESHLYKL